MTEKGHVPGESGTLRQRIEQVVDSEVSHGYAGLIKDRVAEILDDWEEAALERAKTVTRFMFAGLMPGNTGAYMADEVAMKVLAAALASNEKSENGGSDGSR